MGQEFSLSDYTILDTDDVFEYIDGQILDFHIENKASKWKLKAHVMERKASTYCRQRSENGAPVVGRVNPPLSNGDTGSSNIKGDDFPLPSTEEEIQAFDEEFFEKHTRTVEVELREKSRSRSIPDLSNLKSKFSRFASPSKPKFLDRLFSNVSFSRKSGRKSKNGLVIHTRTSLEKGDDDEDDENEDDCLIGRLSRKSDASGGQRAVAPSTSNSSDSGKGSILESTSDFSPTGCVHGSVPGSPNISGIVQKRLRDFQNLNSAKDSYSAPSSPGIYRSRTVVRSGGKIFLFPSYSDKARKHCCAFSRDEKFSNLVMKKGFVKAVVEQINHNDPSGEKNSNLDKENTKSVRELKQRFECSNSVDESNKLLKNKHRPRTPQGSPRLRRERNATSLDTSDNSARNSLRSSEFGGTSQSDSISNGQDRTEAESGIASDCSTVGFSTVNVVELFDSSWSDSDMSFDEYSDWDSDVDNQEDDHDLDKTCDNSVTPECKLHRIAEELFKTEKAYVSRLYLLDQIFQARVREENKTHNFLSLDVMNQMFSNITSIYQFHNNFLLPQLETRMKNWESLPKIGDLMRSNAPFLKLYTEYVKNFDHAMNLINAWSEKSSRFAAIMQEIQKTPECGSLTLQHHMLDPVQRVPRYQLLLQDYLKHLPEDSPDKENAEVALELVTKAASHSNEAMKKIEKFHKLLEINEKFGAAIDLISPTRELVREGRITKISARGGERLDRYVFLFNDLMLICCEQILGSFRIKAQLDMEGLEIMDRNDKCIRWILEGENIDIPNTFYVKSRQKIIQFLDENSAGEPMGWCESMKDTLKEYRHRRQSLRGHEDHLRDSGLNCRMSVQSELMKVPKLPEMEIGKLAPKWIKDDEVTMCMQCTNSFTAFRRRHHCRACGIVVCSKCSGKKVPLAYDNFRYNRVCDKCYTVLKNGVEEDEVPEKPTTSSTRRRVLQKKASDPSVLSSYLQVSTDRGKSWTKRWVVVQSDYVLYCFKAHQDVCALFSIPLPGYTVEATDSDTGDKEKGFKLYHKNQQGQTHYFLAGEQNHRDKWMDVLERVARLELPESEENKRASTQSSSSSSGTAEIQQL
ncbi:FYVE, RhoGEF and PH domain-containing protein 4-like isoform X1 [Pecten maximus]|uniref:FYVE, RhoGEF and PH domain-containing protein 4-like isoform X1 n=1 Tax=Pecten maximus TaxID=6579 RepID=UPI001458CBCF|nr:FYVE, RhoGEF and PH domain-containing protein 4-like isoform X1 [Pecten maximus]